MTVGEETANFGTYIKVKRIDFVDRESPIPKEIVKHGICLDDLLKKVSYDELKAAFLGTNFGDEESDTDKDPEGDATDSTEQEDNEPDSKETAAEEKGLEKGSEVTFKGVEATILKISSDGTSLTLMDQNDDVHKAISPDDVELIVDKVDEEPDDDDPADEENWDDELE